MTAQTRHLPLVYGGVGLPPGNRHPCVPMLLLGHWFYMMVAHHFCPFPTSTERTVCQWAASQPDELDDAISPYPYS